MVLAAPLHVRPSVPGIEPVFSALQGGFLTTGPSGLFLKSQWHIFLISCKVSQRHHLVSNSSRSLSSGEGWSASQYLNWGEFYLNELLRNGWSHPEVESSMSPNLNGHSIPICGMEVRNGISVKALGAYGCFVKLKQLKASTAFFFYLSYKFFDLKNKKRLTCRTFPGFLIKAFTLFINQISRNNLLEFGVQIIGLSTH